MTDSSNISTQTVALNVSDGTTMNAYIAKPSGDGKYPGIIIFQEAFGVNSHIRDVVERFASEGFVAIAPFLFHRTDPDFDVGYNFDLVRPQMMALTDEGQTADIKAAYGWLTSAAKVAEVVTIGYCMGGRTSFLADAVLPIKAAASYYGGGIAPAGHGMFPDLLGRAPELHAPVLLIWGGKDQHITLDLRRAVSDALISANKPYVEATFSDADHAFSNDERPSFNPDATKQAWALTLAFFFDIPYDVIDNKGCRNYPAAPFESKAISTDQSLEQERRHCHSGPAVAAAIERASELPVSSTWLAELG